MNYPAAEQRGIKKPITHAVMRRRAAGNKPLIPTIQKTWLSGCDSVTRCFAPLTLSSFEMETLSSPKMAKHCIRHQVCASAVIQNEQRNNYLNNLRNSSASAAEGALPCQR